MKFFSNLKLAAKISVLITAIIIIGFSVLGVFSYLSASAMLTETIRTNLMNNAESAAMMVSNMSASFKNEAETLALNEDISSMDWIKQKPVLEMLQEEMGFAGVGVSDLSGQAYTTNSEGKVDLSEREYIKKALEGATFITDPILSKVDNIMVIVVAAPIRDRNDKIRGALIITHDAGSFTQMSNDINVGKTGYAFMLNSQGVKIAHPNNELVINQDNDFENVKDNPKLQTLVDIEAKMIKGESGYGEYYYDGVDKFTAFAPVPDTQWSLALCAPKSEFFSQLNILLIVIIGITLVFILISIIAAIFILRSLVGRPVSKLVAVSDKLASGDVDVNIEAGTKDEIGILMNSFQKMIENTRAQVIGIERIASGDLTVEVDVRSDADILGLKINEMLKRNNEVFNNINSAAEQVSAGSKQVSDSSIALSQGAAEQASSIEELTASIDAISTKTVKNAENAGQANELAEKAKENALEGNKQMKEMLKAMQEIDASSGSISKIIKVIDDIAFQTNILALNAAVEAARAGVHGKGFAVVAEEVRNLASRSANAAKETTDLIEGSVGKVQAGTKIANDTAGSLDRIVEGVTKAAALIRDIADASSEQSAAISQINSGITEVSRVVQTNSATSEESAAASEELSGQAELLRKLVGSFKLKKAYPAYNDYEANDEYEEQEVKLLNKPLSKSTAVQSSKYF